MEPLRGYRIQVKLYRIRNIGDVPSILVPGQGYKGEPRSGSILNNWHYTCKRFKLRLQLKDIQMDSFLKIFKKSQVIFLLLIFSIIPGCSKKHDVNNTPNDIWDIDKDGIPKFVNTNYIELSKIDSISKFRSSVGHDYSDSYEQCRSMKHYFMPKTSVDWAKVKIYSPVSGTITRVEQEWDGTKIEIASDDYPAFRISIFHINLQGTRNVDDKISAGELLGTHINSQTYSDVSVIVNDPAKQGRMVSWFDVITDNVFSQYTARGINSRTEMIISKSERDAYTLTCNGDTFTSGDPLERWVYLN
jgi:hypothetical protein